MAKQDMSELGFRKEVESQASANESGSGMIEK